jgi:quercetin dioxygenase-like cupin family protein
VVAGRGRQLRVHVDERRTAYCDVFRRTHGDVNLFIVNPGQRTCWHRHQKQTDEFRVLRGEVLFQRIDAGGRRGCLYLSNVTTGSLTIPPGEWHGYECTSEEPAWILMYLDQPYDPADEEEMSEDVMPWGVTHHRVA